MSQNIKVVFDTQIYLRGAIDPNSVCGKLFEVLGVLLQICTSPTELKQKSSMCSVDPKSERNSRKLRMRRLREFA